MRRATGALAVAAILAVAAPARADDVTTKEAQARFEEGLGRVKDGDFEGARVSFAQAYAVLKKPDILWNLALAEQKSGHPVEAIGHFKQLQREARSDADRANASKHVTELLAQTGHIEVAAVSGAQVSVDGSGVGVAPLADQVDVAAGKHHVEATSPQGAKSADVDAALGQVVHVSFLEAAPTVEGKPQSQQPAATEAQPPSQAGPETTPSAPFWGPRTITVISIGGLAVLAGAMGLGFGVASSNDSSSADKLRQQNPNCSGFTTPGCQQLQSTTQSQHDEHVASEVAWIASGVLAAGAVATWFLWPKSTQGTSAGVRVVPTVSASGTGLVAVGRF
ncbi:MAG TPA: hypothetical protein VMI75_30105 [Polyangiaceae bacterium]|nr:hypothetical protein [Polyangiaceae bacterium]